MKGNNMFNNSPITKGLLQDTAAQVISLMESEGLNWTQSWVGGVNAPCSVTTEKPYQGINWLILGLARARHNYSCSAWGTFKAWKDQGYIVQKGQKSQRVVRYQINKIDAAKSRTGMDETIPMLKVFWVFNGDQVVSEAGESYSKYNVTVPLPEPAPTIADDLAASVGAQVVSGKHDLPCFIPSQDLINMPSRNQFSDQGAYSATLFHELTHWTGHEKRLNRKLGGGFKSNTYAFEELIAEFGAAMLCAAVGLDKQPRDDHAKYLNSWISGLKDQPELLFKAAGKASKAAQYLWTEADSTKQDSATQEAATAA